MATKYLPEFPNDALFFDCRDSEHLTHESPDEAVAEALECWADSTTDMAALIREHSPMEVRCWKRKRLPANEVEHWAGLAFDDLRTRIEEEYGDPDGDHASLTPEHAAKLVEVITAICAEADLWACEDVGTVALTAEQVEALMREHSPEWFEEPAS